MRLSKAFIPDLMCEDVYSLDAECFLKHSASAVIFDIDDTLAPYTSAKPDKKLMDYFSALAKAGINIALVSNNNAERVNLFNEELGFFNVPLAKKPSPKGILKCIAHLGVPKNEVVFVGDQIFTDCLAARRAGIKCFIVKPIVPNDTLFLSFKRFLEKPFRGYYRYSARKRGIDGDV